MTVVYRRRKMDAGFRAACIEAIGMAYHRLELVLLERAFAGTEKVIRRKDGSEERMLEYSNQLGLKLLTCTATPRSRPTPSCRPTMSTRSASDWSTSCNG